MGYGLVGAGMLSGLGQGISHAVDMTTQMKMQEDRNNLLRDLELQRQTFETQRDERKIAAQKELAVEGYRHTERLQSQGFTHTEQMFDKESTLKKGLQAEEHTFQHGEREDDRAQAMSIEKLREASAKEIADSAAKSHMDIAKLDRRTRLDVASMSQAIAREKLEVNIAPDGKVSVMNLGTGKAVDIIGPDNKPLFTKAPLDKSTEVLVGVMKTQMDAYDYLLKNPMLDDARRDDILSQQEHISKQVSKLLGKGDLYESTKEAKPTLSPAFKAWADKYFDGDYKKAQAYASQGKGSAVAPSPSPSSPTPLPTIPRGPSAIGGRVVVPQPSVEEQEMMRRSIAGE